ncbi:hypothetical protein BDV95DRAFT_593399 [Massariosphaeria phaeospora]|uniref:Uncharacterized protein n=1 Tax=Massariosphaeria phaeospora TaxID=100035 RepID=A0A7C8I828_9PLEO|nr:hypothetical protein BDV95DRAFT_593399 [Massariosphaeria phaeospora]
MRVRRIPPGHSSNSHPMYLEPFHSTSQPSKPAVSPIPRASPAPVAAHRVKRHIHDPYKQVLIKQTPKTTNRVPYIGIYPLKESPQCPRPHQAHNLITHQPCPTTFGFPISNLQSPISPAARESGEQQQQHRSSPSEVVRNALAEARLEKRRSFFQGSFLENGYGRELAYPALVTTGMLPSLLLNVNFVKERLMKPRPPMKPNGVTE